MIYGVEFHFFSPARVNVGLSFLQGTLHLEDGDYDYKELVVGLFFFFIEITAKKRVE
jgi:hypothetical protein